MKLRLFQVDAFTREIFRGNPAAVVPLERWPRDRLLQNIARENNLSETAFFVPLERDDADFHLRWFTPTMEVDLCGHATLAAGHVLFTHLAFLGDRVCFRSKSGLLAVTREGEHRVLDFPAIGRRRVEIERDVVNALGARPAELYSISEGLRDGHLAVFGSESAVRQLEPDFRALAKIGAGVAIATARSDAKGVDFASRVFAPGAGIDEDPVTGAAHCALTPYWTERLGTRKFLARQISARGGDVTCELVGNRVNLGGDAVTYLEGTIDVPGDPL